MGSWAKAGQTESVAKMANVPFVASNRIDSLFTETKSRVPIVPSNCNATRGPLPEESGNDPGINSFSVGLPIGEGWETRKNGYNGRNR